MQEGNRRLRHYYERKLSARDKELGECHIRESRNRTRWFQVFQDVQDECERRVREIEAERDYWKERAGQEAEKKQAANQEGSPAMQGTGAKGIL